MEAQRSCTAHYNLMSPSYLPLVHTPPLAPLFAAASDWGLEAYRTHRCTFSDLIVDSDRPTDNRGHYGHHAIGVTRAYDNLVTDFVIAAPYVHDLSVAAGANGNVFRNARAADMNLDFHRQAPYSNLFTNIHAGEGNRPWESGGEQCVGCLQQSCMVVQPYLFTAPAMSQRPVRQLWGCSCLHTGMLFAS
jgi:hypothetical protein